MRDNSKFSRQRSSFRYNSTPGSNYRKSSNIGSGSFVKQGGTPRGQRKSLERPKSEMFKKVEYLDKKIKDILKNMLINTQFVEEEIVIDVKYVNEGTDRMMLIDNGALKSIVSYRWLNGYLKNAKVSEEDVKKKSCARKFRMGKTVYLSDTEVTFPIVLKLKIRIMLRDI